MYSVVLMMALTNSAEVPAFGHRCSGCSGCSSSCSGCYGCSGGCHGGRKHHRSRGCHGCHGCSSSCSGWGGCSGGCSGWGGCSGGSMGCYGGGYGGCYGGGYGGCYGGGYGGAGYGCGGAGYGGAVMGAPVGAPVVMPATSVPATKSPERVKQPKEKDDQGMVPAPATILVSLPADAKLTIDDTVTRSTSSTRVFVSPTLENGKAYSYTLKAEAVRDGKTVTASKKVEVRAGEETRVSLELPVASVAAR